MAFNWDMVREKSRTSQETASSPEPGMETENTAPNGVAQVNINDLAEITAQPFRTYTEEELDSLVSSIEVNGILSPISIRPLSDGRYQIIDGRNRVEASRRAGRETIPALIKDVDEEAAWLMIVDSKLYSGLQLLPMEKAFAYKIKMDAMRRQGRKMPELDTTCVQSAHKSTSAQSVRKLESRDIIGASNDESRETVRRYIALTKLIQPFHTLVNSGELAFMPAVNISSLTEEEQETLYNYLEVKKVKVTTPL